MDSTLMKIARLVFALAALAFGSTGWGQSLYPLFGPSSGIMVGDPATPVTSSATSANVLSLWSGTCSGSTFLNGAGVCTTPAGTGVTSVAQTVPAGFAIAGSPITSTGTLAISYATGQTANRVLATPDGTTGALSLRALVAGDIPPINLGSTANGGVSSATILLGTNGGTSNGFFSVTGPTTALRTFTFPNASATVLTTNAAVTVPQGGTGAATLTGLLKGNGTSAFTAATSADVISLWTGTCNSTTFLRGDGACASAGGGAVGGANTNVQFNNSGVFGGDSGLTYAGSNAALKVTGGVVLSGSVPTITTANSGVYAGGTTGSSAEIALVNSTGAANSKVWDMLAGSSTLQFRLVDDAISSAPTWLTVTRSGTTISSIAFGAPLTITAGAGGKGIDINGSSTGATNVSYAAFNDSAGTRKGYVGDASSGDSDITLACDASPCNIQILPTGTGNILGPGSVSMTPSSGTYTATFNGFSGGLTRNGTYYKIGNTFCTSIGSGTGTSNTTTFTITGIPAAGTPATLVGSGVMELEDNGTLKLAYWRIPSGGTTITFSNGVNGTAFTASGTKGIDDNFTACWITS